MKKNQIVFVALFAVLALSGLFAYQAYAHCQIPCGIYGDEMRFDMLNEHIATIEKSMNAINEMAKESKHEPNQLVRWVMNKDDHADQFSEIVHSYFLAQRIKSAEETDAKAYKEYTHKLVLLHNMIVSAMKCKQTTDLANVKSLKKLVKDFYVAYFGPDHVRHTHEGGNQ
jgi:nickel superoxide dismutase